MRYEHITTARDLDRFCKSLADAPSIAFDTEFISERTYRSELCLVQVAAGSQLAVIDPIAVPDLSPFWELLVGEGHETIVHAGREELVFCLTQIGRRPANLMDVQLAAGLIGCEYPAGYGSLTARLLGQTARKGETRTDWSRRPLSEHQIDYALDDVRFLTPLRDHLMARLTELGRLDWLAEEMASWQAEVAASMTRERWRRVSGLSGLSARGLAIVRELWRWREDEAQRRNSPARRVLRDDLVIELARRRTADPKQIRAVRGLERGDLQRQLPALAACIERALELPDSDLPYNPRRETPGQLNLLGQFLSSALTSICRSANLAPSLVGTAGDVRDLIAYRLGYEEEPPLLARGWREDVVGRLIEDLLEGKKSIRIRDPKSDEPLAFEPNGPA